MLLAPRRLTGVACIGLSSFARAAFPGIKHLPTTYSDDGSYFSFVTRQDIQAPVWSITTSNETVVAPGYWFIAPYEIKTQEEPGEAWVGPHIYDSNGTLIWSGTPQFGHWNVFDFGVANVDGVPHLTGLDWQSQQGVVLDSSYRVVKSAPSVEDEDTFQNMHGFNVVDDGHHGIVQTVHRWDVPPYKTFESIGYNGSCEAHYQGFREMDLDSPGGAKVLFDWNGRKIGLNESTYLKYDRLPATMCQRGWDLLHVNAVDKCPDGDYLLSARHADALFKISHTTGDIVWRLGGVRSDFELQEGVKFSRQHHARCLKQTDTHTLVSLFDNAVGEHFQAPTSDASRGLILALDLQNMTASIVSQYQHPNGVRTDGRGSFQLLPNGNAFLNWATYSLISEHTPDGKVAMQAYVKSMKDTYRAFKHPWIGRPSNPPDVRSQLVWKEGNEIVTEIHMSWNGATEVDRWNVRGLDADGKELEIVSGLPRSGFETSIEYAGYASNVYADALDQDGNVLGTSRATLDDEHQHEAGHSSTVLSLAFGIIGGLVGVLISFAGLWLYRSVRRRHRAVKTEDKGRYGPVDQDEQSWELAEDEEEEAEDDKESEPLKPEVNR